MCEANTILLHDKSPPHQIVKKLAQSFTIKTKRMHWRKEKWGFFVKIKYIIQIILTTVLGPHKIMVARGFTKKPRIETVVCVVFFLFLYSYVLHKWGLLGWDHGGGSLVHGQYIYKKYFKAGPPFTTSQSILDYCGNKSVLRAIFPVLLKDRKVKIQLGNMVKSEYF